MSDRPVQRVEVSVGDVHSSQLVIGDHATIQTPEGTEVTVLQVGDRPLPELRPLPVSRRPDGGAMFGRQEELALVAAAGPADPLQLYGGNGAGKTCLLKFAAAGAPASAEGVVFESVRHRSLDEIQAAVYRAFWQCDIPFVPAPAQMPDFLAEREALLILDDCGLDRGEVETLLDGLPRCTVVLAAAARTLWSRGTARSLGDLDDPAAVALLERELGGRLDPEERAAAEVVVSRLGGKPQTLVETAALIDDDRASLRELAEDPGALERRLDPSALTDSQRRILAILSAVHGAALGTEQLAALTANPELEQSLQELERRGWVKAGSPRYRTVRRPRLEGVEPPEDKIARSLLEVLATWGRQAGPSAVADEAEAIERCLERGTEAGWWKETLALAHAAERGLAVAGAWASCRRVLQLGMEAANALGDRSARAFLVHQLGSQALCLGERAEAEAQLGEALRLREELGEHEGADLTRHNLRQLGGGGAGGSDGGGGGGPRLPRVALVLAAVAVVAGVLLALVLTGGTGKDTAAHGPTGPTTSHSTTTHSTTTTSTSTTTTTHPGTPQSPGHPDTTPPEIQILSPAGEYEQGTPVAAEYSCTDAESEPVTCSGEVEAGSAVDTKTLGAHSFTVTATDAAGNQSSAEASYSVVAPPPPPPPPPPPSPSPKPEPEPEPEPVVK